MAAEKMYDLSYLKSISNNDEMFLLDMIKAFLINSPNYFQDMEAALEENNSELFSRLIHKFIPTLAFVGANKKDELFNSLEQMAKEGKSVTELNPLFFEIKAYCDDVINDLRADFKIEE